MMTEKQVLRQLKNFRQIKPDKDWVLLTKREVLGAEMSRGENFISKTASWFFLPRPAFLVGAVGIGVVAVLVLTGIFGIINSPFNNNYKDLSDLTPSLRALEANLSRATLELKQVKDPAKVLGVEKAVSSTIEKGEKFISQAKGKTPKLTVSKKPQAVEEVLSALTGVESALSEMKETNEEVQKEVVVRELEDLRQRVLSDEQKQLLEEAARYYQDGSYPQALEKIIEISQI